jgi:plasmid stabilization system protein ParE
MTYRLIQREAARRDILSIVDRIADDNPAAAQAVYKAYEYTLELLKTTPDMGSIYSSDDPRLAGIRFIPVHRYRNYLIFCRRTEHLVEVLHVWYGGRDIPSLLKQERDT